MHKPVLPYGLWPSPLTPHLLSQRVRLGDVQWGDSGRRLVWLESRPGPLSSTYFPGGQGVLVQSLEAGSPQDLTIPEHSVRGHWGYGGGEFCAGKDYVLYSEKGGQLYRQDYTGGAPQALTPQGMQISAPLLHPRLELAACVAIRGDAEHLAIASLEAPGSLNVLARGADFYLQPAWSPDGRRLAWIEWDHPGLPWEGCRLMLAEFDEASGGLGEVRQVAGGEDVPVFQPAFSPDGRWLAWIEEAGEWEDLALLDLETGQKHSLVSGAVLSQPVWEQGLRMFAWQADSGGILLIRLDQGHASLWRARLDRIEPVQISLADYTWLEHLCLSASGLIAGVASAAHLPPAVVSGPPGGLEVIRPSLPGLPQGSLAKAEKLSWSTPGGSPVYGLYSPPVNAVAQGDGLPPAVVYIHGGPSTQRFARFEFERSYFTSRGYAWLDVDYHGSTGYGRTYRQALYGSWGLLDVEDLIGGAEALHLQQLANPGQLVLYGSSAGGFALLNAMIRQPGRFAAGLCLYPVTDLLNFPEGDFKLEKYYHARLLGSLPGAEAVYRERSPLTYANRLADPLALFHGLEDPVVPVEQTQRIAAALQARSVPFLLRLYPGEGHGFRKAETLLDLYATMEAFLQQHLNLKAN